MNVAMYIGRYINLNVHIYSMNLTNIILMALKKNIKKIN